MAKKFVSSTCQKCGKVFLLGVNGSGANDGGYLCDRCAKNVRDKDGNLVVSEGERLQTLWTPISVKRRRGG